MRNCPVDDFTLAPETYEGVTIDRCPHCQGVWLDEGELEAIQENQDSDFRDVPDRATESVIAAAGMAAARAEGPLNCVSCKTEMEKSEYSFSSQVMIDSCPKGHGIWLDKSELSRLETFYEDEQDFADMAEAEILRELRGKGIGAFLSRVLGRFSA